MQAIYLVFIAYNNNDNPTNAWFREVDMYTVDPQNGLI